MSLYSLSTKIDELSLVEFDLFVVKDEALVNTPILLRDLEASEGIINLAIRSNGWRGYSYGDDTHMLIGYGTKNKVDGNGLIESEAYSEWLANWKEVERRFKRLLPLPTMSQTQYDALLSLYYHTGDFKKVGSGAYTFELSDYIKNRQWDYVATALIKTAENRLLRQQEAAIMMLADYGEIKDRSLIKEQGLQDIRKRYPDMLNIKQKQQAEYVYYAETKRFLPKMTQSRMRQIVKLLES